MAKRKKPVKYRYNDPKTGRIAWTTSKKKFLDAKATVFNRTAEKEEQATKYLKTTGAEKIKKLLDQNKIQINGFLPKEVKDRIYDFAQMLDDKGVKYNVGQILEEVKTDKDVRNKVLYIEDETPKNFFHWNLHNEIKFDKIKDVEITIIGIDGKLEYKGRDNEEAAEITLRLSKLIQSIENIALSKEKINPYALIDVYQTYKNNELKKLKIDYSQVENKNMSRIFTEYFNDLKNDDIENGPKNERRKKGKKSK